jgi:hypothetical protein
LTELKAVLIMGSQKTLPVCVTIISYFPPSFGVEGLLTLPCIMGHVVQLSIDAVIVSRWATLEEERIQAEVVSSLVVVGCVDSVIEFMADGNYPDGGLSLGFMHGPALPTQALSVCIPFVHSSTMWRDEMCSVASCLL